VKIFKKSPHPTSPLRGEEQEQNKYDLIEEVVKENSFPINKIKKELKEQ
jgi:hypothetical protein